MDIVACEFITPLQALQLNQKIEPDDRTAKLTNKMDRCFRRSSGRQQVVDNQHLLSDFDRITMHCKAVISVFEAILYFIAISRKFSRLADRDESGPET